MPPSSPPDTTACGGNPGDPECLVYTVTADLAVEVPYQQEYLTYLVHGLADISVARDPANSRLWVIRDIVDRTSAALPRGETEVTTWGAVLALY